MVDRFERFSLAIAELSRYWHKITADEMEKYGLRGAHSVYLVTLYRHPEGVTAPRLCELCGRDKADVSRAMSLMEKNGLVVKEGIHQNLYRGVFKLTEAGFAAAEHIRQRASLAVEIAGSEITDENRAIFYEALDTILEKLRDISKEGLPTA